jgi:hypothetical protein
MCPAEVNQPHKLHAETLWQVFQEVLHDQIVAFVVLWLAAFAPITCQYHGMLVDWFDPQANSTHHQQAGAAFCSLPMPMNESSFSGSAVCSHALQSHQTTSDVTVVMSLLTAIVPQHFAFRLLAEGSILYLAEPGRPPQWIPLPPDQPPRFPSRGERV